MVSIKVKIINENVIFTYPFDDITFSSLTLYSLKMFICNSYFNVNNSHSFCKEDSNNKRNSTICNGIKNFMIVYQGLQLVNDELIFKDMVSILLNSNNII